MDSELLTVESALEKHGFVIHNIKGVSMMPLLDQRTDSVRLEPCAGRLSRYDIALYRRFDGALMLHRVIRVLPESYIIRGDNCVANEYVRDDQILAVAVGIFKGREYHTCDEPAIRRYATHQMLTLPWRRIRAFVRRIGSRVYHKFKGDRR